MNILYRIGHSISFAKRRDFDSIEGYADVKDIIERVLETDENYNLLLVDPPASSDIFNLIRGSMTISIFYV